MTFRHSRIIALRKECKSINVIAKEMGVSRQRISQILLQFFPDHVNFVLEKMQNLASSLRAEKPELDKTSLSTLLREGRYKNLPPEVKVTKITPACVYARSAVLSLRACGLTQVQIGKRLGYTQTWVSSVLLRKFKSL